MFEQMQPGGGSLLTKAAVICAVGMGIGFGTCGLGMLVEKSSVSPALTTTGFFLFLASFGGLVIVVLAAIVRALWEVFQR